MTKKTFQKEINPALHFIDEQGKGEEKRPLKEEAVPEGYKLNPQYVETKSKRVHLLLQPSVHSRIKALAEKDNISVNEEITNAILKMLEEREG